MLSLHPVLESGNDSKKLRKLLETGVDPNTCYVGGDTPLHIVASRKCRSPQVMEATLSMARELIAFGAEVNEQNERGYSPLLCAVFAENPRMVEILLEHNADVNTSYEEGNTALHLAITEPNNLSDYPVWDEYYASRKPVLEMVKTLMKFNPDIRSFNEMDVSPLMLAAEYHDFPVLKVLLEHNPYKHHCFFMCSGDSALPVALDKPSINFDIVMELLRHCAEFYLPVSPVSIGFRGKFGPVEIYLDRLKVAPVAELKKAKCVFKVFLLGEEVVMEHDESQIKEISESKNFPLSQYIVDWKKEISQMSQDKLASEFSVYNLAQRGFFCTCEKEKDLFSHVFDAVLLKLKNSEYPLYRDLIASGISRSYLKEQFVKACNIVKRPGRDFLDNKTCLMITFYLSHFHMVNCIIAFSV